MPRPVVIMRLLAAVAVAFGVAQPAAALSPAATSRLLTAGLRPAGGASGAYVVDLDTGETIFSRRAGTRRMPASVEKLFTTSTALLRLGADLRLPTEVSAVEPLELDGTLDGDLYLRGGGDPTLTSDDLRRLAEDVVDTTGLSRVTGRVIGDESAFDTLRGVPSAGYGISVDVSPLGALMVDRGRTGRASPYYQADPAAWAATAFAKALRQAAVRVAKRGRAGVTPPGALTLARHESPDVATLVAMANVPSDNYIAETLLKVLGASTGAQGTTARGAALVEQVVGDELAVHPSVVDGSGLSRYDRTTPKQVVRVLQRMRERDEGQPLWDSLPVAGRTGTLHDRLRASVARDRCRGKTGTLRDVSNLAGYCEATGGDTVAFSILMNRVYPSAARSLQDRMVSAIARYGA